MPVKKLSTTYPPLIHHLSTYQIECYFFKNNDKKCTEFQAAAWHSIAWRQWYANAALFFERIL